MAQVQLFRRKKATGKNNPRRYDAAMPTDYEQLLDATIQHLEDLKAQGVRFVPVSPGTLLALAQPAPASAQTPAVQSQIANRQSPPSNAGNQPAIGYRPSAIPKTAPTPTPTAPASQTAIRNPKSATSTPAASEMSFSLGLPGETSSTPAAPLASEAKAAAFADLRSRVLACVKCSHLASSRKNVVFGVGNIDAQLMFVGEAPGADEDEQGEPFVGKAGQLLTKIIETMGLRRSDVYIGNILKCRPDTPGLSAGNRKPTPDEMKTCIPFLHEQIDLIQPRVLVALSATAVEALLGKTVGITKLRGNWQTYRGIPLMPTFHPAYLLRNQSLAEKRKIWEDMLQVMEKLQMPISGKQRNFFLKS